jgi:hypothetical protein
MVAFDHWKINFKNKLKKIINAKTIGHFERQLII